MATNKGSGKSNSTSSGSSGDQTSTSTTPSSQGTGNDPKAGYTNPGKVIVKAVKTTAKSMRQFKNPGKKRK